MSRLLPCALLAVALPLGGCTAHVPGSLRTAVDTYDVRRVGCLEIAVRALRDPVVAFTFGNVCDQPAGVDFRNVTVSAWSADGWEHHPVVSDPRGELREAVIDGHAEADVALDFPVPEATPVFCVDVARLNVDEPAHHPEEMCFHVEGRGLAPVAIRVEEARP